MTKYKGTFTLLGISIALQVLCTIFPELTDRLCFSMSWTAPFTLFTHMVGHGGWAHLIGNYSFGLPSMMYLEGRIGRNKFLEVFFLCGAFGALLNCILMGNVPMIGSSGAIAGTFAAACCLFGKTKIEHVVALAALTCFFVAQVVSWPEEAFTGVAFMAHIGGALMGMLLMHKLYALEHICKPSKKK